jgi:ribose transport system permease protein
MAFKSGSRLSTARSLLASRSLGPIIILLLLIAAFSYFAGNFLTVRNVVNIGMQSAILLIVAVPMTLVILCEGIDLSPGAVLSLSGVILATMIASGLSLTVATAVAVLAGLGFGALNGALIAGLGLPPFVVTLGTSGMAYGLALALTGGNGVSGLGEEIVAFNDASFAGIPLLLYIALAVYAVFHVALYHTRFGRYVFAVGGNIRALNYAGVNAMHVHAAVYLALGGACGVAALCLIGRTNAGHPGIALGIEFDAIAAVVLGGTAFERGDGWLFGTALGVLVIGTLKNGLNLLAIDTSIQLMSVGGLVLAVLLLDRYAVGKGA